MSASTEIGTTHVCERRGPGYPLRRRPYQSGLSRRRRVAGWSNEEAYLEGDRTTAALLRADISARPSASLLRWIDTDSRALTGCVWLEPFGDQTWYLGSLAINPEFQNGGFGRRMLVSFCI
ncbi:GNAT family N-acetyltransferase [Rhizobium sp. 768_B6_N1_8]|uniref:GNAT family N-acetyltransferase n=1 Tax=unclassified Rhizobium TaxID=2613769 RepID=UPI003F28FC40